LVSCLINQNKKINMEPSFDKDGYPTEDTLVEVENWDYKDGYALFKFIQLSWRYLTYFTQEEDEKYGPIYRISTGGWSGNESLIEALQANRMIQSLYWISSTRNGHYIYKVPPKRSYNDEFLFP
jgi:hypothetical protein